MDTTTWANVQTKLPIDLKRRLKVCAAQRDITQQELLAMALEDYLDRIAPESEPEAEKPRRGKNSKP